jgi:hypothetical protein
MRKNSSKRHPIVFSGTLKMNLNRELLNRRELGCHDSSFHRVESGSQALTSLPFGTLLTILGAEKQNIPS